MKMRASPASHLPSTTFCWLPPLSSRTACVGVALTRRFATIGRASSDSQPDAKEAEAGEPTAVGQCDVARDGQAGDEAVGFAVFGQQADAVSNRVGGCPKDHRRAVDEDAAGIGMIGAREHARQLAATGAEQPADAEHLARAQREADVVEHALPAEVFDLKEDRRSTRCPPPRIVLADLAIRHQPNELGDRGLGKRLRRDVTAVAHHRHALSDAVDLVESMRDVDDRRRRVRRSRSMSANN